MNEPPGLEVLRDHFLKRELLNELVTEFLPLLASFLPASQRRQTPRSREAWDEYVETEAGKLHSQCLDRREADPDAAVTPAEARGIIHPLLDPTRVVPLLSGQRLARFWFALDQAGPARGTVLRFFIRAAATHPGFHEAVKLIAVDHVLRGESIGDALCFWILRVVAGDIPAKPPGLPGGPKNLERNLRICAALIVLQHLGLSPTVNEAGDRRRSGCYIVADVLRRSYNVQLGYNGVATVWTDWRRRLREAA